MSRAAQKVLNRQLGIRSTLWPTLDERELWNRDSKNWTAVPRLMPLMLSIMDDMAGTGTPVSRVYLEIWSRLMDEGFLALNRPEEMAFHAGFEGQRALRTWKERVRKLHDSKFIELRDGPLGEFSYVLVFNPYIVIKRAMLAKKVQARKWEALVVRAAELNIPDLELIDDKGNFPTQTAGKKSAKSSKAT